MANACCLILVPLFVRLTSMPERPAFFARASVSRSQFLIGAAQRQHENSIGSHARSGCKGNIQRRETTKISASASPAEGRWKTFSPAFCLPIFFLLLVLLSIFALFVWHFAHAAYLISFRLRSNHAAEFGERERIASGAGDARYERLKRNNATGDGRRGKNSKHKKAIKLALRVLISAIHICTFHECNCGRLRAADQRKYRALVPSVIDRQSLFSFSPPKRICVAAH